jgi:uncharacterized membrane protein HdeD (DUF308 family)
MTNVNLLPNSTGKLSRFSKALHDHWRLFVVEGLVMIVLGAAAIIVPSLASLAISVFLGWLFLIGGCVSLIATILGRHAPGFWWSLLSAIVTIGVGSVLIGWPMGGIITLTLVLTVFLVVEGVLTIAFAIDHRRQLSQRWGWMLVNGLLDLGLAGIIIVALPASAAWVLGIIVGIDMIFGGLTLIGMARAVRT